ncbi:hypothetical protein HD806DRAFT_500865 [Xylariaceae sp. AK1471]|nr:hypothetical protein HD806DRAFT_500865 [Xylariaceae sp. AK1471]
MIHVIFTFLGLLHLAASEIVSLEQAPAFNSQRPCAQNCFGDGDSGPWILADGIGCPISNIPNECFCRLDRQPTADAFLQSCVNNKCAQNTIDISSAVSIYDAYCTGAGFLRTTPATTTSVSSISSSSSMSQPQPASPTSQISSSIFSNSVEDSSSQTGPSETQAPAPTNSSPSGSNGGGGNGLGTGDIVGIVIGILGFIATAIGAWFAYKAIKK